MKDFVAALATMVVVGLVTVGVVEITEHVKKKYNLKGITEDE